MIMILDVVSIVLIIGGAIFCLAAAVGMARFRDTISRMHPSSKPQTLGLILTLVGSAIHVLAHAQLSPTVLGDLALILLVMAFTMVTAPILSNRIGHEAVKEQLIERSSLSRDDTIDGDLPAGPTAADHPAADR